MPAKFRLKVAFPKIVIFGIWICNLQTGPDMSKNIFDFVLPDGYQNLVKISWSYHLYFLGPQGMEPLPQDAIKLSEMADAINR